MDLSLSEELAAAAICREVLAHMNCEDLTSEYSAKRSSCWKQSGTS